MQGISLSYSIFSFYLLCLFFLSFSSCLSTIDGQRECLLSLLLPLFINHSLPLLLCLSPSSHMFLLPVKHPRLLLALFFFSARRFDSLTDPLLSLLLPLLFSVYCSLLFCDTFFIYFSSSNLFSFPFTYLLSSLMLPFLLSLPSLLLPPSLSLLIHPFSLLSLWCVRDKSFHCCCLDSFRICQISAMFVVFGARGLFLC